MKTLPTLVKRLVLCLALTMCLLLLPPSAHAANYTWSGAGANDNWSTGDNWDGGSEPPVQYPTLFFAGTNRLTPNNNGTVSNTLGIIFDTNAGSFTLTGDALTLYGSITNLSGVQQTIENDLLLLDNRNIDTAKGNILVKGGIGETGGSWSLRKRGAGTLTLAGANTFTALAQIFQGSMVLDVGAGASLTNGTYIYIGEDADPNSGNQGGGFIVRGANTGSTTVNLTNHLFIAKSSGAVQLAIDANGGTGTALTISNFAETTSAYTMNVDLSSSSGNSLYFSNTYYLPANGIYKYITVTDTDQVGFATRDAGTGRITRFTNTTSLPTSVGDSTTNYHVSGDLTLVGNVSANSLTIQSAGTLDGGQDLTTRAVLMQAGVGNYTISNNITGSDFVYFHQYSTSGVLKVSGDMLQTGASNNEFRIVKAGPGTMIFEGTADKYSGALDVQSGKLQLDGAVGDVAKTFVRNYATLSGTGTIGGGTVWLTNGSGGTRYTDVKIFTGGTLDATPTGADALTVVGTLTLDPDSAFKMNLAGTSLGVLMVTNTNGAGTIVTLDGDLQLTLGYTPTLGDEINLLTWTNGTSSGTFASVNGILGATNVSFGGGYNFDVHYDSDRVWLKNTAIPEPAALGLLLAAGSMMLLRRRR